MKLKILSDGTAIGTRLVDATTGESIHGLLNLAWSIAHDDLAKVTVTLMAVPVEIEADIPEGIQLPLL